jgi:hypothetical protein
MFEHLLFWEDIGFSGIVEIPIDTINFEDHTFDIFKLSGTYLTESIKTVGIVEPILLESLSTNSYRIMDGFRRCDVAKSLGWTKIPARILTQQNLCWNAFKYVFWVNLTRTEPHLMTWSKIIPIAKQLHLPPRLSMDELLSPFEINLPDTQFSLLLKLSRIPLELQKYLLQFPLSFRQVERLVLLSHSVLEKLTAWSLCLKLRTQELLEIGEQLEEFYRITDQMTQEKWFKDIETYIFDLERSPKVSPRPIGERILYLKTQLDLAVRPTLYQIRQQKQEYVRQFRLPENISIDWDKNLEQEGVTISLKITQPDDLDQFWKILSTPAFKANIAKLLKSND